MSKNTKQTSTRIGKLAAETLQDSRASQVAKSLAASALSQRGGGKQAGAKMEDGFVPSEQTTLIHGQSVAYCLAGI